MEMKYTVDQESPFVPFHGGNDKPGMYLSAFIGNRSNVRATTTPDGDSTLSIEAPHALIQVTLFFGPGGLLAFRDALNAAVECVTNPELTNV